MDIAVTTQRTRIPLKRSDVQRAAALMLRKLGVRRAELSIVFLTAPAICRLNRKHLGHDYVTDVISFDLKGPASRFSGEIFICPAEARRNAKLYGEPFKRELLRYLAHGILHLAGFDDSTVKQRMHMRAMEDKLLKA
jgi:probable rRNA maturation factor